LDLQPEKSVDYADALIRTRRERNRGEQKAAPVAMQQEPEVLFSVME